YNYVLAANGGQAEGLDHAELAIDGITTGYGELNGYALDHWPCTLTLKLKAPSRLDCVRLLFWDKQPERFYRYKMEIADSDQDPQWSILADLTGPDAEARSWQTIKFPVRT